MVTDLMLGLVVRAGTWQFGNQVPSHSSTAEALGDLEQATSPLREMWQGPLKCFRHEVL